jgi:hypothetical protein
MQTSLAACYDAEQRVVNDGSGTNPVSTVRWTDQGTEKILDATRLLVHHSGRLGVIE